MGVGSQRHATPLNPQERPDTYCIGGWVGHGACLDGCRKSRPDRDSIPEPFRLRRVAIQTELSRPSGLFNNEFEGVYFVCLAQYYTHQVHFIDEEVSSYLVFKITAVYKPCSIMS
jgi:hypothetical protein